MIGVEPVLNENPPETILNMIVVQMFALSTKHI